MVLTLIFRGFIITNSILDLNSVIFTPAIKSLVGRDKLCKEIMHRLGTKYTIY